MALGYDPDEQIPPAVAFNWGSPPPLPALLCECKLCSPPCNKAPATGDRYCMPCHTGYHLWAEAPCGSPFHGDTLDGICPCVGQ